MQHSRRQPTPALPDSAPSETAPDAEATGKGNDRRKAVLDRRNGSDRRGHALHNPSHPGPERRVSTVDRRDDTGLERRRGPGRRRSDERRSAEEGEMTAEQFEFVMAIEAYKKVNKRLYPTWTEILEVVSQLGYRKVCNRSVQLPNVPEPGIVPAA